jgi:ribosomal protein S2
MRLVLLLFAVVLLCVTAAIWTSALDSDRIDLVIPANDPARRR